MKNLHENMSFCAFMFTVYIKHKNIHILCIFPILCLLLSHYIVMVKGLFNQ